MDVHVAQEVKMPEITIPTMVETEVPERTADSHHTEPATTATAAEDVVAEKTRPQTPLSPISNASDSDVATPTPTKESSAPIFVTTTTLHDEPFDESRLCSSPQSSHRSETPTRASTPQTPNDDHTRDSMASIALSETSLDYQNFSTEQVEDILATPRVKGKKGHLRKVSSLEILTNKWAAPNTPNTLFDSSDETAINPMSAFELHRDPEELWRRNSDIEGISPGYYMGRRPTDGSLETIDLPQSHWADSDPSSGPSSEENRASDSSGEPLEVDWQALDKTEQLEKQDLAEGEEDESTAFLLARLEQENAKLAADSKTASNKDTARGRSYSRPPSMAQLKKLVSDRDAPSVRYSMATDLGVLDEVPPMTELEFWAALVQNYPSPAVRLPTLTTTKIRSGIPPPLRGVVWTSMAAARDKDLEDAFERLVHEQSPYEGIINKDVGRSFPGVELFRDAEGEGQKMLGRVLKCFSLHDKDIGYCQGLGFLVGPLLMNMGEREAFCVLVRLMDHYSLRPSFLPSLSGLHMRIYQFSTLLKQHHAKLHAHLAELGVEPAYLSQWFLSCFAVTCPLDMLFRIYDVIFAEGANETVMRVALALMRRHEERMLATTEFEEVMQLLLGREIWDCYGGDADVMVDDLTSLGDVVTHARLGELEKEFDSQSSDTVGQSAGFLPDVQAAASRFLGRLWAPGHGHTPSKPPAHTAKASVTTLSPQSADKSAPATSSGFFRPTSFLRRSPSKADINVVESASSEESMSQSGSGAVSLASTSITEPETPNANDQFRGSVADSMSAKSKAESILATTTSLHDRQQQDLHAQIEDLLTALVEMQREQAQIAAMLQKEREERSEDQRVLRGIVGKLRKNDKDERRMTLPPPKTQLEVESPIKSRPLSVGGWSEVELDGTEKSEPAKDELQVLLDNAQERIHARVRFSTSLETKAQLRSNLARTREQLATANGQTKDMAYRLEASEAAVLAFQGESEDLRSEVQELRSRVADDFKTRQKLEHQLNELKAQARSVERRERLTRAESLQKVPTLSSEARNRMSSVSSLPSGSVAASGGLRELKLGRRDSSSSVQSLRPTSGPRSPTPIVTEVTPPSATDHDCAPLESPPPASPAPVSSAEPPTPDSASGDKLAVSGHRRMFSQRGSSLATQEVFATTQHEPVPEEALLLELVNAKTSEAQALQELDEVKRALAISRRKQDEALTQFRAEIEAMKAEAQRAANAAQAARAESETLRLSSMGSSSVMFSLPTTPFAENGNPMNGSVGSITPVGATPGEEKSENEIVLPKKSDTAPAATGVGATVGWFWQRRTASRSANVVTPE